MGSATVTVLMPVRNGWPYVREAVESVLGQTHRDLELLIVDDGSSDETGAYLRSCRDARLRVVPSAGPGLVRALNTGLAHASGELLARQDADDVSHPERIARQVAFLREHPHVDVVACCCEYMDETGGPIETAWTRAVSAEHDPATTPARIRELLPLTCCLAHGSILTRTAVLAAGGGYRAEYEWAEDYDLWLRLLPHHQFAKLPDRLYRYRLHASQVSGDRRIEQVRRTIEAKLAFVRRAHPELPNPIRAAIQGTGLGAALYRTLAPQFDIVEVAGLEALASDPIAGTVRARHAGEDTWTRRLLGRVVQQQVDLVIVTDFPALAWYRRLLAASGPDGWTMEGNFLVARRRKARAA